VAATNLTGSFRQRRYGHQSSMSQPPVMRVHHGRDILERRRQHPFPPKGACQTVKSLLVDMGVQVIGRVVSRLCQGIRSERYNFTEGTTHISLQPSL
jgi:hypothetical protein